MLQRAGGRRLPAAAQLAATLEQLPRSLQRLYTLQGLDGGWGWWKATRRPRITAYVIQGFTEARRAGYDVDQAVLDRALAYLASASAGPVPPDMQAYRLLALAEAGRLDRTGAVTLFEAATRSAWAWQGAPTC